MDEEINLRGYDVGIKFVRKFYPYYINGIKNAAKYRSANNLLVLEVDYDKFIKKIGFHQKAQFYVSLSILKLLYLLDCAIIGF